LFKEPNSANITEGFKVAGLFPRPIEEQMSEDLGDKIINEE